jgi:phosphatidylinositol phosphate synthase
LFDGRFRGGVDRAVKPVGAALTKTGLSPDHLTALGMLVAIPAAVVIGSGHTLIGFFLLMFAAVPDLLDGALAKASGRSSVRGAFFDSVSDRVTDILILGGVAWYLQDRYHGHAFALPLAIMGASLLISYQRAKAESLGFDAKGGLMERAERVVVLCAGLAFGILLVPLLWVMLALTLVTAVQRFVKVWRQATAAGFDPAGRSDTAGRHDTAGGAGAVAGRDQADPSAEDAHAPVGARAARSNTTGLPELAVAARWRAWREANGWAPRHPRYSPGAAHQAGAADRWRERRRARLEAEGRTVARRRSGTRRP